MNETADLIVSLFVELARLVIIRYYADIFWTKRDNKFQKILLYVAAYVITTGTYLLLHNMVFNLVSTFAGIIMISIAYDSSMIRRLIGSAVILAISVALDLLAAVVLMESPTSENYDLASSFISVFLFLLSAVIAGKIYKRKKDDISAKEWWYVLVITISSTCVVFFLAQDSIVTRTTIISICAVIFLINYMIYNLFVSLEEKHEYERELLSLKTQMNIYDNQISGNIKRDEAIRAMRHDMKHHVHEIYYLAEQGDDEGIKSYVSRMGEQIQLAEPKVKSGVIAIDGVMGYMIEQAEKKGIRIDTHITIPDSLVLSSYDMNILLGNIMQNAIDAAEKCDDKQISVTIKYDKQCIFIMVSNSFNGDIEHHDGEYLSTKKNRKDHGLGLKSVRNIVERYDGSIFFMEEEGLFTVKVVMLIEAE